MIAVTGATGWLGQAVVASVVQSGFRVRALTRRPKASATPPLDLGASAADCMWGEAVRDCDTVIHVAAHVHRPHETADEVRLFEAINVEGTRKLLAAAERAGVRRFVYVSSSAVYGPTRDTIPAEDAPLRPNSHYGRSKVAAEELVRASRLEWIIVRPATIFGRGDRANFARLAEALARGRFVVPGQGDARKSVLPVDLAGELIARLATGGVPGGTVLNLALPVAPTLREICDGFSGACGFARARSVPLALLRPAAWAGDALGALGARVPLSSDTLAKLTTSTVVDTRRMQTLLPRSRWPEFSEALQSCADYYAGL